MKESQDCNMEPCAVTDWEKSEETYDASTINQHNQPSGTSNETNNQQQR